MRLKVKGMIPEDDLRVSQVGHPGPPWSIAYGDLMTELVCFFVILYALSAALNKDMQKAQADIQEMIKDGKMQGQVTMDKEGMRITLEEQSQVAFFESGRAELTDQMRLQLDKLTPILYQLSEKHDIIVEGHTDNIPIATKQFASNWELSSARATSVVKFLLASKFLPKRLAAVGYGENHPITVNDSEPNRKRNRRVVFFVKTNPYPDSPAAAPPGLIGAAAPGAGPPGLIGEVIPAGAAAQPGEDPALQGEETAAKPEVPVGAGEGE